MRRIILTTFIIALAVSMPVHAGESLSLTQWTLSIAGRTMQTSPVPWDRPVSKGGAGTDSLGSGTYRCLFTIPESLRKEQLAFFVSSIDDADRAWFNGVPIGGTGHFPEPSITEFRSGFRLPRLYVIPQSAVRDGENELTVEVYNFAGSGGFNGNAPPVIAPYTTLAPTASAYLLVSDGLRIMLLTALVAVFICVICLLALYGTRQSAHYALRKTVLAFRIDSFIRKIPRPKYDSKGEVIFRSSMNAVTVLGFAFFTLTETTFRTGIIASETFWFKSTEIALFSAFLGIVAISHSDLFITSLPTAINPARRAVRLILKIATHPGLHGLFLVYLIVLPVQKSWEVYVVPGTPLMLGVLGIVFILSSARLVRLGLVSTNRKTSTLFFRSAAARIVFTAGFIAGIVIFHTHIPSIYAHSSILVISFALLYVISSFIFFFRHRSTILQSEDSERLDFQLSDRYDLTPSEVRISSMIAKGLSRGDICSKSGITSATLKIHLKSIYTKTIESGSFTKESKTGKFQRLTIFLHELERGNEQ